MCQLLGMNCATPTDFNFSFRGFARRGGDTDKHSVSGRTAPGSRSASWCFPLWQTCCSLIPPINSTSRFQHGWGLAIYEGNGLRTFLDSQPAAESQVARFVETYPIKTLNMLAHIRYATQGKVALENVHPFQREMWGISWSFCHNGEVPKFSGKPFVECPLLGRVANRENTFYNPIGDTDSEATFCAILNALRAEFSELPTLPVLFETLQRLCAQIVPGDEEGTILNFLLGCGQYTQFAYSWPGARPGSTVWNGLFYTVRKPPFAKARLADVDYSVDFSTCTRPNDRVAVIATAPLTVDEEWKEFKRGELLMFDNGLAFSETYDCHEVEKKGRGLFSRVMPKQLLPSSPNRRYDLPSNLRKLVDQVVTETPFPSRNPDIAWAKSGADLGSGTGCSGLAFRSCCRNLVGVDLSPEMVDCSRERGCYDELVIGNVECVLRKQPKQGKRCKNPTHGALSSRKFDLIFACNVFVYIKDLRNVFDDIRQILNDGGIFAFSAEFLEESDKDAEPDKHYALQSCARYAHKRSYLEKSAQEWGFETKRFEPTTIPLRQHNGINVFGVLVVLTAGPSG